MYEVSKMAASDPVHNAKLDVELILDVCISDVRDVELDVELILDVCISDVRDS